MFSPAQSGANAYARVGVETGVMGASPHKLIVLLYQGARQAITRARMHLQAGNVGPRCEAIAKAIRIVESGGAALEGGIVELPFRRSGLS